MPPTIVPEVTFCRVCGDDVREPSPRVLEWMGVTELPEYLHCLCPMCLECVTSNIDTDDESTIRPVNEGDLEAHMVHYLEKMAARQGNGRPIERCEAVGGGRYIGDPDDLRCDRFGDRYVLGRLLCWNCARRLERGRDVHFIRTGYRRPKPYVVWL